MVPLGLLTTGIEGEVVEIRPGQGSCSCAGPEVQSRMRDLGVCVGKKVRILSNEGQGPVLFVVDETRVAVGRGLALSILVKPAE